MRLRVRVSPNARKSELVWLSHDEVRVRVIAPPSDGKANRAVLRYLADTLELSARDVKIVTGVSSRHKVIEVLGMEEIEVARRLGRPDLS